jgi:hypothetical protein
MRTMRSQESAGSGRGEGWLVPEVMVPVPAAPVPADRSPLERLQDTFTAHVGAETATVTAYRQLADTAQDPVLALLMQMVVDDEARHHGLLDRMAARLKASLEWTKVARALPTGAEDTGAPTPGLVAGLETYAQQDEEGARHLRRLAAEHADLYDGLFGLILETMALYSDKHARILRYLEQRALKRMTE